MGSSVLVFCAASRRLRGRDGWIGWTEEQRRRRLPLAVNNCRFLLLPEKTFPNLGSRSLPLALDRLSADGQARYGHPVVRVETFVDPEQFCGTVDTANGWQELGQTDGFGRVRRDFYVEHNKPKRLFARELYRHARRSLAADRLKPSLSGVEAKTLPRSRVCQTAASASASIRSGAWSPSLSQPIGAARPEGRRTWPNSPKA